MPNNKITDWIQAVCAILVVMFLKQNGSEENGWRGAEFYWPVIVMPANLPNYVYSED